MRSISRVIIIAAATASCVIMISASPSLYVNAAPSAYHGAQHAMMTKQLMSELQRSLSYGLGQDYCDDGSTLGDEGCALPGCSCNSPLTCDTNSGTCITFGSQTVCTGSCRAPVWVWIIMVVGILLMFAGCYACYRRRRAQQAVIMINAAAASPATPDTATGGSYAPPPVGYAQPQPYGQPAPQQTTNYQRLPGQH